MRRMLPCLVGLTALLACQNYDLRHITAVPVQVIHLNQPIKAAQGPPDIMIVQDLSGSMCEPIQSGVVLADAGSGAGDCAADSTQSKIGIVSSSMAQVLNGLQSSGSEFYLGLTAFPDVAIGGDGGSCGAASHAIIPVALASGTIAPIETFYQNAVSRVSGGTPTAAALLGAAQDPTLSAVTPSEKVIILITDGLPNCDSLHECVINNETWSDGVAHGCVSPNALPIVEPGVKGNPTPPSDCVCSFGSCPNPTGSSFTSQCCGADPSPFVPGSSGYVAASQECLDANNTVKTVTQLYGNGQGIRTFVVGMGSDFAGSQGTSVLTQMAQAGQGGISTVDYYPATTPSQLLQALNGIIAQALAPCAYMLDAAPADPGLIEVTLDGTNLVSGDPNGFAYAASPPTVTLSGNACTTIKNGQAHMVNITAIAQ